MASGRRRGGLLKESVKRVGGKGEAQGGMGADASLCQQAQLNRVGEHHSWASECAGSRCGRHGYGNGWQGLLACCGICVVQD